MFFFMIFMVVVLIMALIAVLVRSRNRKPHLDQSVGRELVEINDSLSEEKIEPEGLGAEDLEIGQKVHFQTEDDSKYTCTLIDPENRLFHIKVKKLVGGSVTILKTLAIVLTPFIRNRPFLFWSFQGEYVKTTPIKRIFVISSNTKAV